MENGETDTFLIDKYGVVQNATKENVATPTYSSTYNPGSMIEEWATDGTIQLNAIYINGDNGGVDDFAAYANKGIVKLNTMEYVGVIAHHEMGNKSYVLFFDGINDIDNILDNGKIDENELQDNVETADWVTQFAYMGLYIALVVETIMFVIIYIRRVFTLALYTMIAPLVAFMYPIDKMGDDKAQAFNTWIKDYFFTLLVQPLHLLLYTIFIESATSLLINNPFYTACMYALMITGEKYIKDILGFKKASQGGGPGFAGGMANPMAMEGFRTLTGLRPGRHGGGGSGGSSKNDGASGIKKIRKRKDFGDDSDGSITPSSDGGAGGTPTPGSSGSGILSGLPLNNNRAQNRNRQGNVPSVLPRPRGNSAKGWLKSKKDEALYATKKRLSNAVTGGKYDKLKGNGGAAASAIAKNLVPKAGKWISRGVGTLAGAGIGGAVGLATAITTGDLKNISTGLSLGATTGWNRGGQFGESVAGGVYDKAEGFINDMQQYRIDTDQEYSDKMKGKQELDAFAAAGIELSDSQKKFVRKYAPGVDFDGNIDKLESMMEMEDMLGGENASIKDMLLCEKVGSKFDLTTQVGQQDAQRYLVDKGYIDTSNVALEEMPDMSSIADTTDEEEFNRRKKEVDEIIAQDMHELMLHQGMDEESARRRACEIHTDEIREKVGNVNWAEKIKQEKLEKATREAEQRNTAAIGAEQERQSRFILNVAGKLKS